RRRRRPSVGRQRTRLGGPASAQRRAGARTRTGLLLGPRGQDRRPRRPPRRVGARVQIRAFAPGAGIPEDPVTGSLNASVAQWLIGAGRAPNSYTLTQGTALGRSGVVSISAEDDEVWVGGATTVCFRGTALV